MLRLRKTALSFTLAMVIVIVILMLVVLPLNNEGLTAATETVSGITDQDKSLSELRNLYKSIKSYDSLFATEPSCNAPYETGTLSKDAIQSGLNWINYYRYAARVPAITFDDKLNTDAAYGALLDAVYGQLSHYPFYENGRYNKPSDMSQNMFNRGEYATQTSNISSLYSSSDYSKSVIENAISGQMKDNSGSLNLNCVGHRRWLLNPYVQTMGIGSAHVKDGWNEYFTAIRVFSAQNNDFYDSSYGVNKTTTNPGNYTFIAWPASGYNLSETFDPDDPWSVSLNTSKYSAPVDSELTVTITRVSDNKTCNIKSNAYSESKNSYLVTNNENYGEITYCVIFSPGTNYLGTSDLNGEYRIKISGLKTASGEETTLDYSVKFATAEDQQSTVTPTKKPTVTPTKKPTATPTPANVVINKTNFPDKNFRQYVYEYFDTNKDMNLSPSEISKVKQIDIGLESECGLIASSLKGVEFFTNLESLDCFANSLSSLDLSQNTKLKILSCSHNKLTKLDLSNNTELVEVYCGLTGAGGNYITTLDVSKCKKLKILDCACNLLKKLDIGNNTKLEELYCDYNQLSSLDVCRNTLLKTLDCRYNRLSALDLSYNKKMKELYLWDNEFKKLDVSGCAAINEIYVRDVVDEMIIRSGQTLVLIPSFSIDLYCKDSHVIINDSYDYDKIYKIPGNSSWSDGDIIDTSYYAVTGKMAGKGSIKVLENSGDKRNVTVYVRYKDVYDPTQFWYSPTNYLTLKNVVKGYDNQTKFKPANECTRAQMITFLWRLSGSPAPIVNTTKFKDIKKSDYFYEAVLWAVEKGITTGTSDAKFSPQSVCTRSQAVTFLWRMAGKPTPKTTKNKFKDVGSKDYFYKATIWASEKKIVAGYDDGTFQPKGKCLRRQMVTFLYKYDKYVNGKG